VGSGKVAFSRPAHQRVTPAVSLLVKNYEMSRFPFLLLISILLTACSSGERQFENLPIVVTQPESQVVDMETVIDNAHNEVEKVLPGVNLTFFSFVAPCETLGDLKGEVHLFFSQTRWTLFGQRVFTARVVIDTAQQTLSMKIQDETEQYLSTEHLELTGMSTLEIAKVLENYLASTDRCNDTVVLARSETADSWYIRCGPPDEVFIECIKIDSETGKVTELR
jgi:hypothetical protein